MKQLVGYNCTLLQQELIEATKNSYDGTIGLNIMGGAFRLVCTNGLVIGVVAEKYKNKHIIQNMELKDIDGVIEETIKKTKTNKNDHHHEYKSNNKVRNTRRRCTF